MKVEKGVRATIFTPKLFYNNHMGIKELEERVGQLTDKRRTRNGKGDFPFLA